MRIRDRQKSKGYLILALCGMVALPALADEALCLRALETAAKTYDLPPEVLRAVAAIESGRTGPHPLSAWPWAVNHSGRSLWFETPTEAENYVRSSLEAGDRNLDIGCFQINHRWHSHAFRNLGEMFNPRRNADYAALFLAKLFAETENWEVAVGHYHSRTPHIAETYRQRFREAHIAQSSTQKRLTLTSQGRSYPLLHRGGAGAIGSTVPRMSGVASLLALSARSLTEE